METVTILRELWRRRVLVGLAALAAILVGLMLTYKFSLPPESRTFKVGIATSRILVDTPDSQVVDVAPRGSETVGARANLLANLMTQGEVKAAIAQRAGLRPTQLVSSAESAAELPLAESTQGDDSQAHLMMTRLVINAGGDPLPIIEVDAQAPDAGSAARLATAAVTGLRAYLDSKAATEEVSDARRLRVSGLGAPQVREDIRGPRNLTALGAAAFVFLSGCVGILIVSALARGWRVATERGRPAPSTMTAPPRVTPSTTSAQVGWPRGDSPRWSASRASLRGPASVPSGGARTVPRAHSRPRRERSGRAPSVVSTGETADQAPQSTGGWTQANDHSCQPHRGRLPGPNLVRNAIERPELELSYLVNDLAPQTSPCCSIR